MFNKMQTDNDNLKKHVTTKENYILEKMGLKFHKIAYTYCLIKYEPL